MKNLKQLLEGREEKNPIIYADHSGTTQTVLHTAAKYNNLDIIKFYKMDLEFSDINPLDSTNTFTPMMVAAEYGHVDVINYYIGE